jgi:hypothetical protein
MPELADEVAAAAAAGMDIEPVELLVMSAMPDMLAMEALVAKLIVAQGCDGG